MITYGSDLGTMFSFEKFLMRLSWVNIARLHTFYTEMQKYFKYELEEVALLLLNFYLNK